MITPELPLGGRWTDGGGHEYVYRVRSAEPWYRLLGQPTCTTHGRGGWRYKLNYYTRAQIHDALRQYRARTGQDLIDEVLGPDPGSPSADELRLLDIEDVFLHGVSSKRKNGVRVYLVPPAYDSLRITDDTRRAWFSAAELLPHYEKLERLWEAKMDEAEAKRAVEVAFRNPPDDWPSLDSVDLDRVATEMTRAGTEWMVQSDYPSPTTVYARPVCSLVEQRELRQLGRPRTISSKGNWWWEVSREAIRQTRWASVAK